MIVYIESLKDVTKKKKKKLLKLISELNKI